MSSAPESILFFYEIDIVLDYIYKIIWYFALCAWVISLNIMFLGHRVVASDIKSFVVCVCVCYFFLLSIHGHAFRLIPYFDCSD